MQPILKVNSPWLMSATPPKSRLNIWLYLAFGLVTLGLLTWSSIRLLRETPTREVAVELPGRGQVTARLATDPFPPLPSGVVAVSLALRNSRGVMLDLGPSVPFVLRELNGETLLRSGDLTWDPAEGVYQAGVQFPATGDYWLIFDLESGQQARFKVYVEPAQ